MNDDVIPPEEASGGFRSFYERSFPAVYAYFFRRLAGDGDKAADLTQLAFIAAVDALRAGRVEELTLPYLYGIARHKLVDHYRREERERRALVRLVFRFDRRNSRDDALSQPVGDDVLAALRLVPPRQRAALVLHYLDDLPVAEVASLLGRSPHATESLLARGRHSFRAAYGEVTVDAA